MCREEARSLMDLAARKDKPLEGYGIFGVVKETGVDDEGLTDFHAAFFQSKPLYRDTDLTFYDALGRRKLALTTWNPFALYRGYKKINKRVKDKQIEGNLKGEGVTQGGIVVFGKDGLPKFAYREETGKEVPVDDLVTAITALQNNET